MIKAKDNAKLVEVIKETGFLLHADFGDFLGLAALFAAFGGRRWLRGAGLGRDLAAAHQPTGIMGNGEFFHFIQQLAQVFLIAAL